MFTKAREKKIIRKIRKEMNGNHIFKFMGLNSIKSEAATLLMNGKISEEFYIKVFYTGNGKHYTEQNYDYIMNFKA